MEISYKTRGTCSRSIHITLSDDGVIESCSFEGGCRAIPRALPRSCAA